MSNVDEHAGDDAEDKEYGTDPRAHLTFFETIDDDLDAYGRYLEFDDKNLKAFSIKPCAGRSTH
jgi:hypothetical protein